MKPVNNLITSQNNKQELNQLKVNLVERITQFEKQLIFKYKEVQDRLIQRESELDQVKKLFLEKLRELDSNFAEISD